MTPILSIIVISHEQREQLRRCLDSILAMQLPFTREIIVSDDRSQDGTREMLENEYADRVIITYCNSDESNCANNSQRSGYNRCHAYPLAKGKYIAHVDADDYFRPGADVYAKQIAALEQHPECALAMSNCLVQNGDELSAAKPWPFPKQMTDGEILDVEEFFSKDYFRINQCFIQRCNPDINPVALYGNRYVDSVITYHHLQFGRVIYVDACDYVYVRSAGSVTRTLTCQSRDSEILWCLGLYIPLLIPSLSKNFFMGAEYQHIRDVIKMAKSGYQLAPNNYQSLQNLHAYIYDCFCRKLTCLDQIRLSFTDKWMKLMKRTGCTNRYAVMLLRTLLYAEYRAKNKG